MADATTDSDERLDDIVTASALNAWMYCPRLAVLQQRDGEHRSDANMQDGLRVHRHVDEERGQWPEPADIAGKEVARALWLTAYGEGISARLDLVEATGVADQVRPVDYKRGEKPENSDGAWPPERVQVCAQVLVLRENGYAVAEGAIWYAASRRRVAVVIDDLLIGQTRDAVKQLRAAVASETTPPPLVDSPKCNGCSLAPICLPDELNWLCSNAGADLLASDDVALEERLQRRLVPARTDSMPFHVATQGAKVGISGEELVVSGKGDGRAPLAQVSQVALYGGVQISTQALTHLVQIGINVAFLSRGGWFYAQADGMPHNNVYLRIAQYAAAADPLRSLALARQFVVTKIRNQRHLLRRNGRVADGTGEGDVANALAGPLLAMAESAKAAEIAADLATLMGCEGFAARTYFEQFDTMVRRPDAEKTFQFSTRNRRPPTDPINACLSFTYALLAREWAHTLWCVGLDPLLGFLHQPRHGRPALALDMMETFRPLVADSAVLMAINNGELDDGDFVRRGPACNLNDRGRKKMISAYERRIDQLVTHPVFGYRINYRQVFEVQARLLGRHLLGEIDKFPPFETR